MYRTSVQHLYQLERRRVEVPPDCRKRLNRLERPVRWPFELDMDVSLAVTEQSMRLYPDIEPLYQRLAQFVGVPATQIAVGAGSDDLIRTLFWLCGDPGDTVAVTWPTCFMYDIYAEMFQVRLHRIVPTPGEQISIEDLVFGLPSDTKLLFLVNPGQPVESYYTPVQINGLAAFCLVRDIILVVDEAYYGFGAETVAPLVEKFDNLLVLRSFSKVFGAAGLRVGYAVGSAKAITPLRACRLSHELSGPSVAAATVLLERYQTDIKPWSIQVQEGRDWLRRRLTADGYKAWGSWANHVLIKLADKQAVRIVWDGLKAQGVYVKGEFPEPLADCLLVTCGPRAYMEEFYEAFRCARQLTS